MIRHWAYALSDMNPAYLDPEFAAGSRYGGIVSPPVMLQSWTMAPPKLEGIHERGGVPDRAPQDEPTASSSPTRAIRGSSRPTPNSRSSAIPRVGDEITAETVFEIDLRREEDRDGQRASSSRGRRSTEISTAKSLAANDSAPCDSRRAADGQPTRAVDQPATPSSSGPASRNTSCGSSAARTARRCGFRRGRCAAIASRCNWDYVVSIGRGTVYSFVMPKYPPLPFIQYPYVVALIELDEGVRIVSNLCDIEPEAIENGMPGRGVLRDIRSPSER